MGSLEVARSRAIAHVERYLRRVSAPRLHMFLILCATGICGFVCSFTLLHVGMKDMAVRYFLAVLVAYLVFFLLLRLWLSLQRVENETKAPDAQDAIDIVSNFPYDLTDAVPGGAGGGDAADAASSALDLDELGLVIAAIATVLGGLIACGYVVYTAPPLFAELLVDGALMSALSHRLRGQAPAHWMYGAIRRTWFPALIVAILFAAAGFALQHLAPRADSIGDAIQHLL